jgi:Holliday junction resolvase
MGKINSKDKGARGERELANKLKEYGYCESRRGQQYNGLEGEDVLGLPGVHVECKRVETLNIDKAFEQSCDDAKGDQIPVVMHRKNHKPWKVTLSLENFIKIYKKAGIENEEEREDTTS